MARRATASRKPAIASVGDLHCGSVVGLHPPDFLAGDDRPIPQNPLQSYLWECWEHYAAKVAQYNIVAVTINGDAVDGAQRKNGGAEVWSTKPADQCLAAEACIQYLLDVIRKGGSNPKLFFVSGTSYHVGDGARDEEALARAMKAVAYKGEGSGDRIRDVLNLDVEGVTINWAHHVSYAPVNSTSPIEREIEGAIRHEFGGYPHVDALIRNHVHKSRVVQFKQRIGATSPCWQLRTPFMRRGGVFRGELSIGGLLLEIDPQAKKSGLCPVQIHEILYDLPKVPVTKL
jgi:hypothetical protein